MSWWIKGVRGNGFRHHFLQCHAICLMCILLVNKCPAFDLVNAINYVNVWVLSFGSTVICKEVCHMCGDKWFTDLDWDHTIVSGGILRVDLTVPIVDMQVLECV